MPKSTARTSSRHRPTFGSAPTGIADIYLVASATGIIACAIRIATAYVPWLQAVEGGTLVWVFACLCGAGFALASAHSWRVKTGWFTGARP